MIAKLSTRWLLTVWAVLVVATLVSVTVGAHPGATSAGIRTGTVIALIVAFIKVHVIGMQFMELRHAPRPLARLFTAWVTVVATIVIILYSKG